MLDMQHSTACHVSPLCLLIPQNALRIMVVSVIGDLLLFLGKVAVAAGCGLAAFGMSELDYYTDPVRYPNTLLSRWGELRPASIHDHSPLLMDPNFHSPLPSCCRSPIFPIALSVLIGFVVAQIFFAVYEMAIDTVILAFCEDCELHGGEPKWAPPLLMEAMGMEDRPEASKDLSEASKPSSNAVVPY